MHLDLRFSVAFCFCRAAAATSFEAVLVEGSFLTGSVLADDNADDDDVAAAAVAVAADDDDEVERAVLLKPLTEAAIAIFIFASSATKDSETEANSGDAAADAETFKGETFEA